MKRIAFIFLISITFTTFFACSQKSKDAGDMEYVIKVDSVAVADTLHLPGDLVIAFYGIVGPDGCHQFKRFHVDQDSAGATMTLIGSKKTGADTACPEFLPLLDGITYEIAVSDTGNFRLNIVNPGLNQVISKSIKIVEP